MTVEKTTNVGMYASSAYVKNQDSIKDKADTAEKVNTANATEPNHEKNDAPVTLPEYTSGNEPEEEMQKTYELDQQVLHERIKKALDNYSSRMGNFEAKFGVHEETNRVMIKLVDKDTKKVLKEIPPEKTLDMIAKCLEIAGVLVDEKI